MKVLVCIKQVIDHKVKIRIKSDRSGVDIADCKLSINPFDEIAVEEAVRLKEQGQIEEIIVVSIGGVRVTDALRTALALGADRGVHVSTDSLLAPLTVAKTLAAIARIEQPALILAGKQAIDDDCNQTGQMLAALLAWPQATNASTLILSEDALQVIREMDGGMETLCLQLPAVVTTDLRLNTPRNISLPNIMKAKKKPLTEMTLQQLGIDPTSRLTLLKVSEPPQRAPGIVVTDVDALIHKLKNEAKVV
ncbi:electron transfer flavoprotein subunit beta/FixA family protein [Enterobacteriaceae bacterium H11S18]|uniref:electron transfer flavoprotein subunit beta/FixA family protein n=1 Tax=Dryocola clanedunensis TaxID=2925396 RepID=UPI0022F11F81|nr:electron transfer flavoprotein subunit beta/FixA family protein [Dryocola clanedunensis]MCT4712768.1 electron transfer flavoprotein subunit beta/FixA family protein [Dryocola clanedunensis]